LLLLYYYDDDPFDPLTCCPLPPQDAYWATYLEALPASAEDKQRLEQKRTWGVEP